MSTPAKSQFNVYLPPELIREIKHAAIDDLASSLSEYVEDALRGHLARRQARTLALMPVMFVSDVERTRQFLSALGLEFTEVERTKNGGWIALRIGESSLGLHHSDDDVGTAAISFVTEVPLEELAGRLKANGVTGIGPIIDETFGRSMTIEGPDGEEIYIGEHDPELIQRPADE